MSRRKPTIDDIDDVDDEDGVVEEESRQGSDLKLPVRRSDEVALGGTAAPDQTEATDSQEER